MNHESPKQVIKLCVLAAGTSSRFGATKLVQDFRGKSLLQHALLAARDSDLGSVCLVVGHDRKTVIDASAGLYDHVVVNDNHRQGIGTSIRSGVRACRPDADGILLLLADQPLVTAVHLQDLVASWSGADSEIISSCFGGTTCPPILFPKNSFDALSELSGDMGARQLLENDAFVVRSIEFPPAEFDVDTPQDLQKLGLKF
jgi:molybdenum cofactor cytidylyltransferase